MTAVEAPRKSGFWIYFSDQNAREL